MNFDGFEETASDENMRLICDYAARDVLKPA
jgi:hypothetical protein